MCACVSSHTWRERGWMINQGSKLLTLAQSWKAQKNSYAISPTLSQVLNYLKIRSLRKWSWQVGELTRRPLNLEYFWASWVQSVPNPCSIVGFPRRLSSPLLPSQIPQEVLSLGWTDKMSFSPGWAPLVTWKFRSMSFPKFHPPAAYEEACIALWYFTGIHFF